MRILNRSWLALSFLLAACGPGPEPAWSVVLGDTQLDRVLLSVSGDSLDTVWAVGGGLGTPGEALVVRRTPDGWQTVATGFEETLWWVWVAGPDDVFMVGEAGRIAHWDGSAITPMTSPTTAVLFGVWGSSPTDVWAVGGDPFGMDDTDLILHYDGTEWTVASVPMPEGVAFFKVWGAAADDVWVVGQRGQIVHFDGAAWSRVASPTTSPLFTVSGNASGEVWAVGGPSAVILRYEGGAWVDVPLPGPASVLNGVAVSPAGEVQVVGSRGTKWWLGTDGVWLDEFDVDPADDLHAAWIRGDDVLAVGGNFNAPAGSSRVGVLAYRGTAPPPSLLTR